MLHIRLCHSLNLQFGAITVVHTLVLLTLMNSCQAQPHVIGPSHPVVATLGDDVVLPCRLDPPTTALKLTVDWTRPDLDPRFVLVLRHNVELDNKHPAYEGRTSLFSDELKLGNISLKLSRVRTSDEGGYRCFVPELNREAAVQLVVGAASSPVIQMITNSSSIDLQCDSTGWYPEPEVFWLDGEGNLLSAGPPETVRGPDDLYTVSSRVTVEKRHSNSFTCRVTQKKTNQTRETQIQVPDDFFIVPPGSRATSSVPAIVGAVLGIMFILAVAAGCLLWKWRQNKNKRRSLEDGAELTKGEKTEGEEESVPLMSGREDNDVNNESQSEKENLKLVAQRETQQDQLMITSELITDMGGAGADGDNERVSLIPTERETHQQQEMMRRREQNDCVKEERQEKKKPDKEDSELPTVSISEGQREQPHNLQTDQEEKKEEETQKEKITEEKQPRREEDETEETSETKIEQKDNEQQREDSKLMKQKKIKKERSEQKQLKEEKSRRMGQRDQSKKKVKDTMELKSQEDQKQGVSKLEPEDKKEKDQERNQNDRTGTREEEAENRKEEINEKSKKESEEKSRRPQLERQEEPERVEVRMKLPTQKKYDHQKVLDGSKQETGHEDKKGKVQEQNQSKVTRMTERKADSQILERTDVKKEGVNPSVSPAGPDRPDLRGHQETAERNKQEVQQVNELQTEKQQRDEPQRNERESKEQPERSAEVEEEERSAEVEEEVEGKGGQEERTDGGADREETQKTSEETEKHRQKQSEVKEETGEQLQESSKDLTLRGAESLDGVKEEETNGRGFIHVTQRKGDKRVKRKWKKDEVCHDHQQQTVERRKTEEEDTVQTEEDVKKTRQDTQMEVDEAAAAAAHTEQEVTSDSEGMECDSEPYNGSVCQEEQDEQMEL